MNKFDDELTDVIPTTKAVVGTPTAAGAAVGTINPPVASGPVSAPAATPPTATAATAAAATATAEEPEDVPVAPTTASTKGKSAVKASDWDDESLGAEGDGLIRIRPEKDSDRPVRFSVLPGKLFSHRQHWITVNGQKSCRLCLSEDGSGAYCCDNTGEDGKMHIVAPAVQYLNTDANGQYPKGVPTEVRLGYIDISPAHFKALRNLGTEDQPVSVTDCDVLMRYEKKRYSFKLITAEARWRKIAAIKEQVEADLAKLMSDGGRRLIKRLGKPTTLQEWKLIDVSPC